MRLAVAAIRVRLEPAEKHAYRHRSPVTGVGHGAQSSGPVQSPAAAEREHFARDIQTLLSSAQRAHMADIRPRSLGAAALLRDHCCKVSCSAKAGIGRVDERPQVRDWELHKHQHATPSLVGHGRTQKEMPACRC